MFTLTLSLVVDEIAHQLMKIVGVRDMGAVAAILEHMQYRAADSMVDGYRVTGAHERILCAMQDQCWTSYLFDLRKVNITALRVQA